MPSWVKLLLLGTGVLFLIVGYVVGVVGARAMRANVARLEELRPLIASEVEQQAPRTEVLIEGVISRRNPVLLNNTVAYIREELDVTTDADGDRNETWRFDMKDTPRLVIDADGPVQIANESYTINHPHTTWYDEATLGFNNRPRDGSKRYSGLLIGQRVTVHGDVALGAEGNELSARTIFGGTHEEFIASQRSAATLMPILGGVFGVVGLILSVLALIFFWRR